MVTPHPYISSKRTPCVVKIVLKKIIRACVRANITSINIDRCEKASVTHTNICGTILYTP